jgi:hypothetical protein
LEKYKEPLGRETERDSDSEGKQVSHKSQRSVYFISSFFFSFSLDPFSYHAFFSPALTFFMGLFFSLFFLLATKELFSWAFFFLSFSTWSVVF